MRPAREHATANRQTYFVTSRTAESRLHFRNERWARLFIETLYHYRSQGAYELHAFVVMPDHFHAVITPGDALERAMQFIKGGFSYRVKKELDYRFEVWQKGFSDHRIRDVADYKRHIAYTHENPVRAKICQLAEEFPYSSAFPGVDTDPIPQRLKPVLDAEPGGAPEGAPFQSKSAKPEHALFQNKSAKPEGAPFQSKSKGAGAAEAAPLQDETTSAEVLGQSKAAGGRS